LVRYSRTLIARFLVDRNGHWPLRVVPKDIKLHNPSEARRNASGEEQTQTIFVACTAVREAHAASRIEVQTGIPVVTTNLAAASACLRHCELPPDPTRPSAC
jgi:maleate cis-trans isomerase